MQLDIPAFLLTGKVPADVVALVPGSRKLEVDLRIADLNGRNGPSLRVDNLCIVKGDGEAINWNDDEGIVEVGYEED